MNSWIVRAIIIILAIAFLPVLVMGTAKLISNGINAVDHAIHSVFLPFAMPGEAKLQGVIKLCLYLISITFLIKILFGTRGGG